MGRQYYIIGQLTYNSYYYLVVSIGGTGDHPEGSTLIVWFCWLLPPLCHSMLGLPVVISPAQLQRCPVIVLLVLPAFEGCSLASASLTVFGYLGTGQHGTLILASQCQHLCNLRLLGLPAALYLVGKCCTVCICSIFHFLCTCTVVCFFPLRPGCSHIHAPSLSGSQVETCVLGVGVFSISSNSGTSQPNNTGTGS